MAKSNIEKYENSVQDGVPVECYKFTYQQMSYLYTSAANDIELQVMENNITRTEKYFAEMISRSNVKPGSTGSISSSVITVSKDHAIAKLYQGPPTETPVTVLVYRAHEADLARFDVVLFARVSQVSFKDSQCEITVTQENWLNKELPNGMNQYYCNNVIFDHKCRLNKEHYAVEIFIDKVDGLEVFSEKLAEYEDGYFEGGKIYFDGYVRMIAQHKGSVIKIKYPFMNTPRNNVTVVPGCDHLFKTCALRYKNALNFSGVPYCPPTDSEKNPTGKGAYWVDSLVVQRDTDGFVGTIEL